MDAIHRPETIPRGALIGAAGLIGLTLLSAAIGRLTGPVATHDVSAPLVTRDLRFADQPDGAVIVTDAHDGTTVDRVEPGTNGFLRASLRGLARARYHADAGAEAPFRLTEWADGRWTLEDLATHRILELEAFGATNLEAFAKFAIDGARR